MTLNTARSMMLTWRMDRRGYRLGWLPRALYRSASSFYPRPRR